MVKKTNPCVLLKIMLMKLGLSQRQLAFGSGVDESQVSLLIKYGIGTDDTKTKIAEYLKVDPKRIFRGEEAA